MSWSRRLLGFSLLALGVIGLSYLQGRFDHADLKQALEAVRQRFPDATDCRAEVVSRFRGEVSVNCGERKWEVNVVKGMIGEVHGS